MNDTSLKDRVTRLPDPEYTPYRRGSGGDVPSAIDADAEHVLRTLVDFPHKSVSLSLRFHYRPFGKDVGRHDRLAMYIMGQAGESYEGALRLLLEQGPFTRFYELVPVQTCPIDCARFAATCDVVRRQSILSPTVTGESNPRVLSAYHTLTSFEPKRDNDYLRLDAVLDRLDEDVLIEIGVEPVDITDLRAEHTNYLAVIQSINRSWDIDDELAVEPWFDSVKPAMNVKTLRSREPLIDVILRTEQKNHETLGQPHLKFHIRVFARQADTARLIASVLAESAFQKGSYELFGNGGNTAVKNTRSGDNGSLVVPLPPPERLSKRWGGRRFGRLLDLGTVAPADELLGVFRFPYASSGTARCMATVTDPPSLNLRESIVFGHDELSSAKSYRGDMQGAARGMRVSALAKHGFLTGMPGGGKTTLSFDLLAQLAERDIPFIVFESGSKREYRTLKCLKNSPDKRLRRLAKRLRVFTPGNEAICPLRFNPLQIPEGISRDEWIGVIVACFKASMAMFEPLPVLLAESLEQVYEDCTETGKVPTMVDLYRATRETLAQKGYSGEVESNLRAALEVRLGELTCRSIGRIFACEHNIPEIDDLMTGCSVIELAGLCREHGCLLALFLSTYIAARIQTTQGFEGDIRLVIIIEEAHNIVGRSHDVGGGDDEHVDPKAHASEFVCRMLAEFRALRVPVLIVDQLPSAVAPEVVKNTATKMAFRQVDAEDRETLAAAMLFGPLETEEIARLTPGLGYFHTEGYHRARLIRTRNLKDELDIPSPPVGKAILPYLKDDAWFRKISAYRLGEDLSLLHKEMDALDVKCAMVTKQFRKLLTKCEQIAQRPDNRISMRRTQIADDARRLRGQLSKALSEFKRGAHRTLTQNDPPCPIKDKGLRRRREQLIERFGSTVEPAIIRCLAILDSLIDGSHKIFTTFKEKANETQR